MLGRSASTLLVLLLPASISCIALADIEYYFSFGDSYTATGYNPALGLGPNDGQTISTLSGGPNWGQYLASVTSAANTYYNFAVHQSSTDNSLVNFDPVPSFVEQVELFQTYFTPASTAIPWASSNTLFSVFFGINDIGGTVMGRGLQYPVIASEIMSSYDNNVAKLYAAGARNFLILNVPPIDQSPFVESFGADTSVGFKTLVTMYNTRLSDYASGFEAKYPGTKLWFYDTNALLTSMLANPAPYGITYTAGSCDAYSNQPNNPGLSLPACGIPLSSYFWWNPFHPTFTVQKAIATGVEMLLTATESVAKRSQTSAFVKKHAARKGQNHQSVFSLRRIPELEERWTVQFK